MTRNTCVSAFICGSHICKVQPSEFDSIRVGPPSRPSTDTLSRQPSASIIGILCSSSCAGLTRASILKRIYRRGWIAGSSPAVMFFRQFPSTLLFLERSEQAVDQGLRGALIGHRLEQLCQFVRAQMGGDLRVLCQHVAQAFFLGGGFFARGPRQVIGLDLAVTFCER